MLVYVVAIGVALLAVPLTRGSFRQLAKLELQAPAFLFGGLAIQIALEYVPFSRDRMDDLGLALLLASYVLLLSFCFVNIGVRGMVIIATGIACNALVIGLNQGMPTKVPEGEKLERTVKHRPERDNDLLPFLGDIIVLPSPWNASISFGDLILAVGLVDLTFWGSRKRRRRVHDDDVRVLEDAVEVRWGPNPPEGPPRWPPPPEGGDAPGGDAGPDGLLGRAGGPAEGLPPRAPAEHTGATAAAVDLSPYEIAPTDRGALRRALAARVPARHPTPAEAPGG